MAAANPFSLENEVALITGGGTGIGLAMARQMIAAGATVVLAGRREEVLRGAVSGLGERAKYVVHDVADIGKAKQLISAATAAAGAHPTVLVNNAGIHLKKWAVDTTEEEFLNVLNTHVMGSFSLTRAVAPLMLEKKHGSILFIASMTTIMGMPQVIAYSAAKAAYGGMVRALATEFSPHGVRVNAVAPGWIETAISRKAMTGDPAREQKIISRTPMGRFGVPDDIGYAAVYLSAPAARFVTGVVLPVDGGASIGF